MDELDKQLRAPEQPLVTQNYRFLGFINDVGEAMHSFLPKPVYLGTYVITGAYAIAAVYYDNRLLADKLDADGMKDAEERRSRLTSRTLDNAAWHLLATVAITPLVVMAAIPFSLIGILPAHWALGAFFTATSMIGFMAGAGIVVRNSIILVDFIELRRAHGLSLRDAVVEAGAVRFRPMLLTALAVVIGASVILADPIFQGLAISLMAGEIASLLISRMAVPVLYYMANHDEAPGTAAAAPAPASTES